MSICFVTVARVVSEQLDEPYAYGSADCFCMGMAVASALTGRDHGESYRGRYSTKTGAARLMRRLGHDSLALLLGSHFPSVAPAAAQLGDLAVVAAPDGEHVAVCMGTDLIVKTPNGARRFAVANCIAAFRVG